MRNTCAHDGQKVLMPATLLTRLEIRWCTDCGATKYGDGPWKAPKIVTKRGVRGRAGGRQAAPVLPCPSLGTADAEERAVKAVDDLLSGGKG